MFKMVKINTLKNNEWVDTIKCTFDAIRKYGFPIELVSEIRDVFDMNRNEMVHICYAYESVRGYNENINQHASVHFNIYNRDKGTFSRAYRMIVEQNNRGIHHVEFEFDNNYENRDNSVIYIFKESAFDKNIDPIELIETDCYFEQFVKYVKEFHETEYVINGLFAHEITDNLEKEHFHDCLANGCF